MFDLVIKNGKIVTSAKVYEGTVCIKGDKIIKIMNSKSKFEAKEIIDAEGNYIFPGAIDTHVHLNDPGYTWREDYEHGTIAAALGGTTTVLDMPLQNEPVLSNGKTFDEKHEKVSKNAYVDYAFWGGLVDYNFDSLIELHQKGCIGFKSFIGPVSPDYVSLTIGQAREALAILKSVDARTGFHCEDFSIIKQGEAIAMGKNCQTWEDFLNSRPLVAEVIATKNIIDLAKEIDAKVHICHVSHPDVAEVIRQAQLEGLDVTGETCSHYLTFNRNHVIEAGSIFKCAPPLREEEVVEEMWEYVDDGTLSCISSDHSPSTFEEKNEETHGIFGVWGGISGLQNVMQVTFSEGVNKRGYSPTILARALSQGPAKAFNLQDRKGAIEVGLDADLVILDPNLQWEITPESLKYVNKISAFIGLKGKGLPVCTILRGKIVAKDGILIGQRGYGEIIKGI